MSPDLEILSLRDALLRWGDRGLLQKYQQARKQVSPSDPRLRSSPKAQRARKAELVRDFLRRIEEGLIHLSGVMVEPDWKTSAEAIPGSWIANFEIDWDKSTLTSKTHCYTMVRASLQPFSPAAATISAGTGSLASVQPEDVAGLSDETVLALLEDHHRRVVESPDARLFPPGKISVMPLIRRKMEARAAAGELMPGITAESEWLAAWIAGKLQSHQTPTSRAIANGLRSSYVLLAPQSKDMIQFLKD